MKILSLGLIVALVCFAGGDLHAKSKSKKSERYKEMSSSLPAEKLKLIDFKKDVYSETGEDGIIEKIFHSIGVKSKRSIEISSKAMEFSNTAYLFHNLGWTAIIIEPQSSKFQDLLKNLKKNTSTVISASVGEGEQSLESILNSNAFTYPTVDLLSIHLNGNDYYAFASLDKLHPRVIVCEYNSSLPAQLDIHYSYQTNGSSLGASVEALNKIAKQKGYTLVALTEQSAFFVKNSEIRNLHTYETAFDKIKIDRNLRYVIADAEGHYTIVASSDFVAPSELIQPFDEQFLGDIQTFSISH